MSSAACTSSRRLRTGYESRSECSVMNLPQLVELISAADWFAEISKYPGTDDYLAITNLIAPEVSEPWNWLPTSRDESDPLHPSSLMAVAKQEGNEGAAKEAALLVYKAALVSLRSVREDDLRFVFGPHNFANAAKGGALYAARQSAIEIVTSQASDWCSLIALYAQGYWPCGYTRSHRILVY